LRQNCIPSGSRVGRVRWLFRLGVLSLLLTVILGVATVFTSRQTTFQLLALGSDLGALGAMLQLMKQMHKTQGLADSIVTRIKSGDFASNSEPPSSAKFILLLIPRNYREHLVGDLEEEYTTIVVPEYGLRKARLWYWVQVLCSLLPLLWAQIRRMLGLIAFWRSVS